MEVAQLLVERGAGINAARAPGTAPDYAINYGTIAEYLRSVSGRTGDEVQGSAG